MAACKFFVQQKPGDIGEKNNVSASPGKKHDYLYKIAVFGGGDVGQTSIVSRFARDKFSESEKTTIGVDFAAKTITVQEKNIKLQIWDVGGRLDDTFNLSYGRDAVAYIVVYDVTKNDTFKEATAICERIRKKYGQGAPIFLVGTKTDLSDSREVSFEEGQQYATAHGLGFMEVSPLKNENIDTLFYTVAETVFSIDNEENDKSGCWPVIPEIPCLGAVIDDMSPEAQLGAAFCLFAVGALTATAGVLLALVLVHSIIPSLGITSPIAIGGCVAAVACIVSGVALMGASIKMAQNAFALFPSPDEVEKPSKQRRNCLRHFLW